MTAGCAVGFPTWDGRSRVFPPTIDRITISSAERAIERAFALGTSCL